MTNYVKIPQCTCGKCECGVGAKVVKMIEEEQARQFLMGLDDEIYANVQSQVLTLDPLPSLDKIFNIIQQKENHKQLMLGRDNRPKKSMAFAVRYKSGGGERNTCKHCRLATRLLIIHLVGGIGVVVKVAEAEEEHMEVEQLADGVVVLAAKQLMQ